MAGLADWLVPNTGNNFSKPLIQATPPAQAHTLTMNGPLPGTVPYGDPNQPAAPLPGPMTGPAGPISALPTMNAAVNAPSAPPASVPGPAGGSGIMNFLGSINPFISSSDRAAYGAGTPPVAGSGRATEATPVAGQPWTQPGYYPPASAGAPGSRGYVDAWNKLHPDNINSSPLGLASDGSPMAPPTAAAMQRMLPQGATMTGAMTLDKTPDGHSVFNQPYTPAGSGPAAPSRTFGALAEGPYQQVPGTTNNYRLTGQAPPPISAGPGGAQVLDAVAPVASLPRLGSAVTQAIAPATSLAHAAAAAAGPNATLPALAPAVVAAPRAAYHAPNSMQEELEQAHAVNPNTTRAMDAAIQAKWGGKAQDPTSQALAQSLANIKDLHDMDIANALKLPPGDARNMAIMAAHENYNKRSAPLLGHPWETYMTQKAYGQQ